jgi:hypothetical protein
MQEALRQTKQHQADACRVVQSAAEQKSLDREEKA